jgi:hypothetical protein
MRIDRRLLGWGAFLIIAGAIPLAVRAGALSSDSLAEWPSLWPLFLVGAGLGLLLRRTPAHLLGGAISVLTAGVMIGGLLAVGFNGFPAFGACGSNSNGVPFASQSGSLGDRSDVQVEFNCGQLNVGTVDGSGWTFDGTGPAGRQPEVTANSARVRIVPARGNFGFNDPSSTWNVSVPRTPTVSLSVTLNAGEGNLDLRQANLAGVSLTLNAGSLTADLSNASAPGDVSATVNAGSLAILAPSSANGASITINAGSAKLCVAPGTPVRVSWSGTIAGNNFDAVGLIRQDDNHWITPGLTSPALDLNVSANAGSFNLVFGGSCHA